MKQNITKEQWDELDGNEQCRFVENSYKAKFDSGKKVGVCMKELDQLPNIGQLIEFLRDKQIQINGGGKYNWQVDIVGIPCIFTSQGKDDELTDALWEAVKHKLK